MARSTQELRDLWSPPCQSVHREKFTQAYQALDSVFHKHGYAPRAGVCGSYNCRHITGGTNYSLHAYKDDETYTFWTGVRVTMAVAVDINWDRNPYGSTLKTDMPRAMIDEICAIRTVEDKEVWRWGGYYSGNKDAMHFEIIASPTELAKGIKTTSPEQPVDPGTNEDDEVKPILYKVSVDPANSQTAPEDHGIWVTSDFVTTHVLSAEADVHGHGLGWWPKDAIFVPKAMHDWMVENTKGHNEGT